MTARVLTRRRQVDTARAELRRRGLSCLAPIPYRLLLHQLGFQIPATLGYRIKSWDVLQTVSFLDAHLPRDASILDLGANTSEIPCILHRLGFSQLTGIDRAPEVVRMPHADCIRFVCGDYLHTDFAAGSFAAITAISAIEHGYDGDALFRECARLLAPGGYLLLSFDYWPDKIDTTGTLLYGMSWTIFSRAETLALVATAARHGFSAVGDIALDAEERVVRWGRWAYTFAWLALRRAPGATTPT